MLIKNSIVTLSDGKDYYVVDEIIFNNIIYYYLATTDENNIDIMFSSVEVENGENVIRVVTDKELIIKLTEMFENKY